MVKRLSTAAILTVTGIALSLTLQHTNTALGYGYGVCTADHPNELAAEYVNNNKRIQFSWDPVTFSSCADEVAASYRLQVRKTDATLITEYEELTNTYKKIAANTLKTNKPYQFRVKATASDGTVTEWSLYKSFRTLPKKPEDLTVITIGDDTAHVEWENVPRSKKLRYYQVVVKRGSNVVFSKRLSLGLRSNSTGTQIDHLKPGVRYRVKVRAVARSTSKGEYAKQYFTL